MFLNFDLGDRRGFLVRRSAMKWTLIVLAALLAPVAYMVAMSGTERRGETVNVLGSTSIQPFAEMLAQEFNQGNSCCYAEVQGGGSSQGIKAAAEGLAQIGMCSRELKADEERLLRPVCIARDALAIVTHPGNPVEALTRKQVAAMFAGEITDWSQVGGRKGPIHIITREEGSGTREAFQKMVMAKLRISRKAVTQESNGAVKELVTHDPAAIGYMSLGLVGENLRLVRVDGVLPSNEAVMNHRYPLVRPFLFVTRRDQALAPSAQTFIDYVLSDKGQAMLQKEGLVGVK